MTSLVLDLDAFMCQGVCTVLGTELKPIQAVVSPCSPIPNADQCPCLQRVSIKWEEQKPAHAKVAWLLICPLERHRAVLLF